MKWIQNKKKGVNNSVFAENVLLYIKGPSISTRELLGDRYFKKTAGNTTNTLKSVTHSKITNTLKSVIFLNNNGEQIEDEIRERVFNPPSHSDFKNKQ